MGARQNRPSLSLTEPFHPRWMTPALFTLSIPLRDALPTASSRPAIPCSSAGSTLVPLLVLAGVTFRTRLTMAPHLFSFSREPVLLQDNRETSSFPRLDSRTVRRTLKTFARHRPSHCRRQTGTLRIPGNCPDRLRYTAPAYRVLTASRSFSFTMLMQHLREPRQRRPWLVMGPAPPFHSPTPMEAVRSRAASICSQ